MGQDGQMNLPRFHVNIAECQPQPERVKTLRKVAVRQPEHKPRGKHRRALSVAGKPVNQRFAENQFLRDGRQHPDKQKRKKNIGVSDHVRYVLGGVAGQRFDQRGHHIADHTARHHEKAPDTDGNRIPSCPVLLFGGHALRQFFHREKNHRYHNQVKRQRVIKEHRVGVCGKRGGNQPEEEKDPVCHPQMQQQQQRVKKPRARKRAAHFLFPHARRGGRGGRLYGKAPERCEIHDGPSSPFWRTIRRIGVPRKPKVSRRQFSRYR